MSRGQPARETLAFLLSLVPYLLERERADVAETADRFGVSPAAVRDAVRLVAVSGVPGETGSYQHADLFDIDWDAFERDDEIVLTNRVAIDEAPRFSAREAAALLAGLQYLSALPHGADSATIGRVMAKLSSAASGEPSQVAVRGDAADAVLAQLPDAIDRGVQVEFDYVSARGAGERRTVDPLRIDSVDTSWYLRGWCHLRGGVRTFRVDRMADLVVTGRPRQAADETTPVPDELFSRSGADLLVTVDADASVLDALADYLDEPPATVPASGTVRVVLRLARAETAAQVAAGLSGMVEIVGPPEVREAAATWAAAALSAYDRGQPDDV